MDVVVAANKESALLSSLEAKNVSDAYSYRLSANFPNGSRNVVSVSPQIAPSGDPAGKTVTFRLPRYGLLQRAVLQSTLVNTAVDSTDVDNTNLGERVFSDISMKAHSKQICSNDPDYQRVRGDNSKLEKNLAHGHVTNSPVSFAASATCSVYTPVYMPFFEKSSNYLDLQYVEQLDLECTVNSAAGMGLAGALASGTFTLFLYFRDLSPEVRRAYEAKNFGETPLNMLIYDHYTEQTPIANGATSTSIDLKVNHAVFATHIYVRDTTNVGPDDTALMNDFSVSFTGRNLLSSVPAKVMDWDNAHYDVGGLQVTETTGAVTKNLRERPISIYWGESHDRTYNSHSVAMSNINNPQITVSHVNPGKATAVLVVVHEYWKLATIDPSDGRIDIGYSL